jgi:23S rRNA pseudouridine1911/1915/1917 synthase
MANPADLPACIRNGVPVVKRLTPTHRQVDFLVRGAAVGVALRVVIEALCPRYSQALLTRWAADGRITVDGGPADLDRGLPFGAQVALRVPLPPPDPTYVVPPLVLVHADDHVLVADKAIGQLAHQAGAIMSGTLLNQLQDWVLKRGGDPAQVRLVNRIDRDTGGLVLVSRALAVHQVLSQAVADRQVHKEYLAICHGVPTSAAGEWTDPIGLGPAHTVIRQVRPDGQACRTAWQVAATDPAGRYALLRLVLHTGRQHQIRVHASHHGFPLVGDWVYGRPCRDLPGQALHAAVLGFTHPVTGAAIQATAPATVLLSLWERLAAGGTVAEVPLTPEQRARLHQDTAALPG